MLRLWFVLLARNQLKKFQDISKLKDSAEQTSQRLRDANTKAQAQIANPEESSVEQARST